MEKYITPLNYCIFIILYITSFVYIYKKYSEIVGLGVLTVIQIGFTLFFGKEISQILFYSTDLFTTSHLILFSSIISMILLTISLILTTITVIDQQEKYNNTKGTPIELPPEYQTLFDNIKENTVIILTLTAIILCIYHFYKNCVNVPIIPVIVDLIYLKSVNIPAVINIIISITVLVLSSYQVKYSNDFSEIKKYSLIGR